MWTVVRDWIEHLFKPRYRPERHYMRGGKTAGCMSRRRTPERPVRH